MDADDHRGWDAGRLQGAAPGRDQLAVAGEDDRLGRGGRHMDRDLAAAVVVEGLGDQVAGWPRSIHAANVVIRRAMVPSRYCQERGRAKSGPSFRAKKPRVKNQAKLAETEPRP